MTNKLTALPKSNQTPIEIALKIDENGMTTAKALYEFLELDPSNYSRWCKDSISNNAMAEKDVDYFIFVPSDEKPKNQGLDGRGRPSKDYKLTARFAKKLAMLANCPKGDMAKDYFIKVEDTLKTVAQNSTAIQLQQSNDLSELHVLKALIDKAIETDNRMAEHEESIADMQEDIDYIKSNIENNVVQIVEEIPVVERNNKQIMLADIAGEDKVLFTTTDIALGFGMTNAKTVSKFLSLHGIIEEYGKGEGWMITERYEVLNLCSYKKINNGAKKCLYIYWNEQGVRFIVNFLKSKGFKQVQPIRRNANWRKSKK